MIELLQSEWDKDKTSSKYLTAAITEKIVNLCKEVPLLGVNEAALNKIRKQHASLISAGKIINNFAQQHRSSHIDYLSAENTPANIIINNA